jgi:hypothetical protein
MQIIKGKKVILMVITCMVSELPVWLKSMPGCRYAIGLRNAIENTYYKRGPCMDVQPEPHVSILTDKRYYLAVRSDH